jgi:hypothetical protein
MPGAESSLLFEQFGQFGLVGLLSGVITFFAWLLLTRTLDAGEKDLQWHREELDAKRREYTESLKAQQGAFAATIERLEQRWQKVTESICQRLDQLALELRATREEVRQRLDHKS